MDGGRVDDGWMSGGTMDSGWMNDYICQALCQAADIRVNLSN